MPILYIDPMSPTIHTRTIHISCIHQHTCIPVSAAKIYVHTLHIYPMYTQLTTHMYMCYTFFIYTNIHVYERREEMSHILCTPYVHQQYTHMYYTNIQIFFTYTNIHVYQWAPRGDFPKHRASVRRKSQQGRLPWGKKEKRKTEKIEWGWFKSRSTAAPLR